MPGAGRDSASLVLHHLYSQRARLAPHTSLAAHNPPHRLTSLCRLCFAPALSHYTYRTSPPLVSSQPPVVGPPPPDGCNRDAGLPARGVPLIARVSGLSVAHHRAMPRQELSGGEGHHDDDSASHLQRALHLHRGWAGDSTGRARATLTVVVIVVLMMVCVCVCTSSNGGTLCCAQAPSSPVRRGIMPGGGARRHCGRRPMTLKRVRQWGCGRGGLADNTCRLLALTWQHGARAALRRAAITILGVHVRSAPCAECTCPEALTTAP